MFQADHVPLIIRGIKVETRRTWDTPKARPGKRYPVQIRRYQPGALCPMIAVRDVWRQRLGDMTERDANREGGFSLSEFKWTVWPQATGLEFDEDLVVYVVSFLCIRGIPNEAEYWTPQARVPKDVHAEYTASVMDRCWAQWHVH